MELEELKSAWQTVKPQIPPIPDRLAPRLMVGVREDVKSRLLRRYIINIAVTALSICLMATSVYWAPLKLPVWWLATFCIGASVEVFCSAYMYRALKRISLCESTNVCIFDASIKIKKCYRNMEVVIFAILVPLLLWLSFTPMFAGTWRMYFVWALTLVSFIGEFFWYRSNMRYLAALSSWPPA